ncbi:MAG: TIGR00730 family Rossman fold protein [Pseudomonadota bacterium]
MIESVCVYCGSSNNVDDVYKQSAIDLAQSLVKENWTTVYGGASVGLMGLLADTALEKGGQVIGVMVESLVDYELDHKNLTEIHIVPTMHQRKQKMVDLADAFVVLPGGIGTMDEFFEVITWKQIGLHDKPTVVVNIDGYWDNLTALVSGLGEKGFMRGNHSHLFTVVDTVEDVADALKAAPSERFDPSTKWI